jgi:hypothetical protein
MPPEPFRLLFVCLGNICRSPAADGVMRDVVEKSGLSARIDHREYAVLGCDIATWLKAGLLDYLVVGQRTLGGYEFDLAPFVQLARGAGTGCAVLFGEEGIVSGHDLTAAEGMDADDRLWLIRLMAGRDWIWIEGNHDAGPTDLGGTHLAELTRDGLTFRHIGGGSGPERALRSGISRGEARWAAQGRRDRSRAAHR